MYRTLKAGFSLIEIIVVVAVLSILAVIAVPLTWQEIDRAKLNGAEIELDVIKEALGNYYIDMLSLPPDRNDNDLDSNRGRGLENLLYNSNKQPDGWGGDPSVSTWNGLYLSWDMGRIDNDVQGRKRLTDPWGNVYVYDFEPTIQNMSGIGGIIASSGPDGSLNAGDIDRTWNLSNTGDDIYRLITTREYDAQKRNEIDGELDVLEDAILRFYRGEGDLPGTVSVNWDICTVALAPIFTNNYLDASEQANLTHDQWGFDYLYIRDTEWSARLRADTGNSSIYRTLRVPTPTPTPTVAPSPTPTP